MGNNNFLKMSGAPMNPEVIVVNTTTTFEFPHTPVNYTCPTCKATTMTRVEKKLGSQFIVCLILCIVFIWSIIGLILLICLCCNAIILLTLINAELVVSNLVQEGS